MLKSRLSIVPYNSIETKLLTHGDVLFILFSITNILR